MNLSGPIRPLTIAFGLAVAALPARAAEPLEFNRDIRPILSSHCFACHGFDAKQRKADLRLDVAEGAFADRDGVHAIKPRDLTASELWQRITSDDPNLVMPPVETKKPLSAAEKATLRRWIEEGASYQKHWAFEPPQKPAPPAVKNETWVRNDVDRFILARLEREGLSPRPEADRPTLIRRVAFALTGLPPTPAEVSLFEADRSANAYEHMADRYLASPRYGEEMARHWLDVARYADTHGLHLDNERGMWAYRDWVIASFNRNQPFDAFTRDQLAGDLVPNPTQEQLVATGFNRCNVTTSEGGSIEAEFVYRYAVDRTSEVVETWMGLTGGCAVCHDHKYDPLSQREFYSLYAFFLSAADPAMDRNANNTDPYFKLPTPAQQEAHSKAQATESEAKRLLEETAARTEYRDPAELPEPPAKRHIADVWLDDDFPLGAKPTCSSRNPSLWDTAPRIDPPLGRRALRQAAAANYQDKFENPAQPIVIPENATLSVQVRLAPDATPKSLTIELISQRATHRAVWRAEDQPAPAQPDTSRLGNLPAPGRWTLLEIPAEKLDLKPGDALKSVSLAQNGGIAWWDALTITGEIAPATDPRSSFLAWWKDRAGKDTPAVPADLAPILKAGPDAKPADEQRSKLHRYYLAWIHRPTDDDLRQAQHVWRDARSALLTAQDAIPGTFIFKDLAQPREAFVMLRGQYDKPGEKVEPGVPAILPPLKLDIPDAKVAGTLPLAVRSRPTRLDLANWLLAPEHPLTARVAVNRFWQQLFGTGLVKTSGDFGSQGELPSHSELLDWLAVEFQGIADFGFRISDSEKPESSSSHPQSAIRNPQSWDTRALIRLLVTSATFRQETRVSPELLRRDPDNRLYARGARFRLDAEQIRDNALFVSGLINLKMGGRGAMPYQPPNIWEPVGYSDSNTRFYLQDHGADLYRRSIYCFLKRTAPPPFMSNFDAPNREQFCPRRERSNTPLQALQLMNDTQHFEAARAFAERILSEGGDTSDEQLAFAHRSVLSRNPKPEELAILREALDQYLARYKADPESARKAVTVGESKPRGNTPAPELAAWTLMANLILNLDETVTRN